MIGAETASAPFPTPTIEQGVRGPGDQLGLLLRAPHREELAWDIEMEIVSARREWLQEQQAWWIASAYLQTLVVLVLRSFPSVLVLGRDEDRLISRDAIDALQGRLF